MEREKPASILASTLVVDDDMGVRFALSELLEDAGYLVDTAEDGEDALALLEKKHFDVVCTDLQMPGIDGYELVDRVRRVAPRSLIVVMSAHMSPDSLERLRGRNVRGFVMKPFRDANEVLKKVAAVLERAQRHNEIIGRIEATMDSAKKLRGT